MYYIFMNYENKKIKDYSFNVLKRAKIRDKDMIIDMDTILTITFIDDTTSITQWDYKKFAEDYIHREMKRTGSFRIVEARLF